MNLVTRWFYWCWNHMSLNQWWWLLLVPIQCLNVDWSFHLRHTKLADKILIHKRSLTSCIQQCKCFHFLIWITLFNPYWYHICWITWFKVAVAQPTPAQLLLAIGSLESVPSLLDLLFLLNVNPCKPVGCFYLHILQVLLFLHDLAVCWVEISSEQP